MKTSTEYQNHRQLVENICGDVQHDHVVPADRAVVDLDQVEKILGGFTARSTLEKNVVDRLRLLIIAEAARSRDIRKKLTKPLLAWENSMEKFKIERFDFRSETLQPS